MCQPQRNFYALLLASAQFIKYPVSQRYNVGEMHGPCDSFMVFGSGSSKQAEIWSSSLFHNLLDGEIEGDHDMLGDKSDPLRSLPAS